ncbi:MAG TPA: MBL fold metallo-hydrolase [Gammaproteobacteria bacterium]|nr:MBL fold metallo-hydrolase [Gammaproteobacteria bacterium]
MKKLLTLGFLLFSLAGGVSAQQDFSDVEIVAAPIRDGLYLVTGRGGNIVASTGADGTFLVDDQYAPLTERIQAALDEVTDQPVHFVINTHWHGDHVGGNENFAEAGAVIVAHENVRRRMSSDQFMAAFNRTVPAAPARALPVITFAESVNLHLNGIDVRVLHIASAHTDGDALVYFEQADVLHMGDIYFNGLYPFIDLGSGGSIDGMIAGVARGVEFASERTVVVPGHGALGDRNSLAAYGEMLAGFRDRIAALKADGKSLEEVVAARPTAEFDEVLGKGFIPPERLVGFIYESL